MSQSGDMGCTCKPSSFSVSFHSLVTPRASLEGEGGRLGQFQSGCRAGTGDVKAVGGWAVTGGWKCGWGWCWGMGMPFG